MANSSIGKRDAPRGKFLPVSAFVLLLIYAVVQLQSDFPSRWSAFLRLGGIISLPQVFSGASSNQDAVIIIPDNDGTQAPIPQIEQSGEHVDENPEESAKPQDTFGKIQVVAETVDIGDAAKTEVVTETADAAKQPEKIELQQEQQQQQQPQEQEKPKEDATVAVAEAATADSAATSVAPVAAAVSDLSTARQVFEQKCTDKRESEKPEDVRNDIKEHLASIFKPPTKTRKLKKKDPVKPCPNTFIDLGANIGDSMGKLIDAGFPSPCPNYGRNKNHARYNLTSGVMDVGLNNQLITFARNAMSEVGRHPEDYCYVGLEGNPVFTDLLQSLEAKIMDTTPRPLQAAHFYTETVGAGSDGPTFLYLDTVNAENNFWGSSIISTHQDAQKSAAENGNVTVKAPVMGLTLSTLLRRSVQQVNGSHVIIKIDIEGGEYPVINEAIDTLCEFTSSGVRIDLMMETHSHRVTGQRSPDMRKYFAETKNKILQCNIFTGALSGASH